ncbi:MAG: hypothetical protein JXA23_07655 [Bacteroidales bacterium]|nr:hypothetical protein [Bacteroidales bacterium]
MLRKAKDLLYLAAVTGLVFFSTNCSLVQKVKAKQGAGIFYFNVFVLVILVGGFAYWMYKRKGGDDE